MSKYFYDDALEAAYMCKHFGMKFHTADNDKWLVRCHDNPEGIMVWWTVSGGRRLYVDENCYEILIPNNGDTVLTPKDNPKIVSDREEYEYQPETHISLENMTYENYRIIRRNGKAFFAPEISIDSHLPTVHIDEFLKDKS